MAWVRYWEEGCGGGADADVFLYDGDTVQQITESSLSNQTVGINDSDELVWTRYDFCPNPWESDIMLYSGGATAQLTDGQIEPQIPDINNVGQVVWGGPGGVELWEEGLTTLVTDWGRNPALNSLGDVVFHRWYQESGTYQIWVYQEDAFLQITDTPVWNVAGRINDSGEIVWQSGIYPEIDVFLLRRIRDGDGDFDGDIDMDDFVALAGCITGPVETDRLCECRFFDLDHDRDVDVDDYLILQANLTGPGV